MPLLPKLFASLAVVLASAAAFASEHSTLHYTSTPNDWVGGGETVTVTSDALDFSLMYTPSPPDDVEFAINNFFHGPGFPVDPLWWYFTIATADGAPLAVGDYEDAERAPFRSPGHPGLEFVGNGRGDNALSGHFDILAIDYDADMQVTSLAVDFTQFDEDIPDERLDGSLRFNSDLPIAGVSAIPEPTTYALLIGGLVVLAVRARRKRDAR